MECSICPGERKSHSKRGEPSSGISKSHPVLSAAFDQMDATSFLKLIVCPEAATPVTPRVPQVHLGQVTYISYVVRIKETEKLGSCQKVWTERK